MKSKDKPFQKGRSVEKHYKNKISSTGYLISNYNSKFNLSGGITLRGPFLYRDPRTHVTASINYLTQKCYL
jgi:hypothetical protein